MMIKRLLMITAVCSAAGLEYGCSGIEAKARVDSQAKQAEVAIRQVQAQEQPAIEMNCTGPCTMTYRREIDPVAAQIRLPDDPALATIREVSRDVRDVGVAAVTGVFAERGIKAITSGTAKAIQAVPTAEPIIVQPSYAPTTTGE
jgi:hypothetical protein